MNWGNEEPIRRLMTQPLPLILLMKKLRIGPLILPPLLEKKDSIHPNNRKEGPSPGSVECSGGE